MKEINPKDFIKPSDKDISDYPTSLIDQYPFTEKEIYEDIFMDVIGKLRDQQINLFSEEKQGLLVILQGMDAAGKDEAVTTVFSNLSAQGLNEYEPGKPDEDELNHDYLWRHQTTLPARGEIAVLNRSYYEEVVGQRVHNMIENHPMPDKWKDDDIWNRRYHHLNEFERYLTENGFTIVKFFFHTDKEVQKERLLERIEDSDKNWDFSFSDVDDRDKWEEFHNVYNDVLDNTSTDYAPWYVLPADDPWFTRLLIAEILSQTLEEMAPQRPTIADNEKEKLREYEEKLKNQ